MKLAPAKLGDLQVSFTLSIAATLRSLGIDPQALMEQYGLDASRLAEPGARLSIPRFMRLGHAAISLSQQPAFGLLMGQHSRINQLGLVGITAAQAPNVREAARALTRFEALYSQNYRGQSSFHEDAQGAWIRFYSISPYNAYNRFVVDSVMSSWLHNLSEVATQTIRAEKCQIEFAPPSYAQRYNDIFDCPVEFEKEHNQLRLSQSTLSLRNPVYCPSTWRQLLTLCEQALEQLLRSYSLSEQVIRLVGPLLRAGEPDLDEIASKLRMPSWTLRRKLAEEGSRYRDLLNTTRRDLALSYIRDTELAFGEIAYLLGFNSAEAFQRAFKRWCQQTPGEFRRQQRQRL